MREYLITASWDDKECVWTATSNDVKGLCLESANLDDIIQEAQRLIPELLVLNGHVSTAESIRIPFRISAERTAVAYSVKSKHTANEILKQAGLPKTF